MYWKTEVVAKLINVYLAQNKNAKAIMARVVKSGEVDREELAQLIENAKATIVIAAREACGDDEATADELGLTLVKDAVEKISGEKFKENLPLDLEEYLKDLARTYKYAM